MKKPNITEGEWVYNGIGSVVDSDNDTICAIHSMRITPDSKAISAVPNLLDDAIRKYNWMIRLKFTHPHLVPDEEIEQTYQALKKAGCYE